MNAKKWFLLMIVWLSFTAPLCSMAAAPHKTHSSKKVHSTVRKTKRKKTHIAKKIHHNTASIAQHAAIEATPDAPPQHQSLQQRLTGSFIRSLSANTASPPATVESNSLASALTQRLTQFAYESVHTFRYSSYKFGGTYFDLARGIYILDCSSYVDFILRKAYPNAYQYLVNATGADRPTTSHYYDFFNNLSSRSKQYWRKVEQVGQLRSGDIIVFRTKNQYGNESGHIMIVMDKPVLHNNNAFQIRVADSAPNRHSQDTRSAHQSGIGIGTVLLKADPNTYEPFAYAWTIGAHFKKNVNFAMARPVTLE
ncbi:MAG: hypothetical protein A3F14_04820 [Gammaproteobacteria bacterium RIFCSPHIGHO2_12_FULL_43_28]|nr:MAG: hypothetical protein A3F14_04820 [Gammaproteobacteria bacterium RIFCSPHIGHO2_12_FULL_43_28]